MGSFGENLKNLRISYKLSQTKFGEMLGYKGRTVCDWELNRNEPSFETLKDISKKFSISIDELLDY